MMTVLRKQKYGYGRNDSTGNRITAHRFLWSLIRLTIWQHLDIYGLHHPNFTYVCLFNNAVSTVRVESQMAEWQWATNCRIIRQQAYINRILTHSEFMN
jgi:hypothetical protein